MLVFEKMGIIVTVGVLFGVLVPVLDMLGLDGPVLVYEISIIGIFLSIAGATILVAVYDLLRLRQRRRALKRYWKRQLFRLERMFEMNLISEQTVARFVEELENTKLYVINSYSEVHYSSYVQEMRNLHNFMNSKHGAKVDAQDTAILLENVLKNLLQKF